MTYRVYLSYSTHQLSLIDQLHHWLYVNGIEVTEALLYPTPGEEWRSQMSADIRASDCVLAFVTHDGYRAEWVITELTEAKRLGKRVIALCEEECRLPVHLDKGELITLNPNDPALAVGAIGAHMNGKFDDPDLYRVLESAAILAMGLYAVSTAGRSAA